MKTLKNKTLKNILAATLASAVLAPAYATVATFDFADLKWNNNQNTGFLPSETLNSGYWQCTSGDTCSSDIDKGVFGGDLQFTSNGIAATFTGFYNDKGTWIPATVVQDHENTYNAALQIGAGLGVYHKANAPSDDNMTTNERLVLTFDNAVTLQNLMLRSDGHNTSNWIENATFELNGVSRPLMGDTGPLNMTGKEFIFDFGGTRPDQFYLSGMTVSTVSPVPEPAAYMTFLAGLATMGFAARRRRNKQQDTV